MSRRKSDGTEGRTDESQVEPLSPDLPSDDASELPPAGAESAPEPVDPGTVDPGMVDPAGGGTVVEPGDAPATETVDTAAADISGSVAAGTVVAGIVDTTRRDDKDVPSHYVPARPAPAPELSVPAENTPPQTGPDLREAGPSGGAPDLSSSRPAEGVGSIATEAASEPQSGSRPDPEPFRRTEPEREEARQPERQPDRVPERTVAQDAHDDEDEGGASIASWVLGILLLLLAGAALGIWGGPKIAPHLPSGMQPVADWLQPGRANAEAEITSLREEISSLSARIGEAPTSADLESQIGAAVSPVESRLSEEIEGVRQSIGQFDDTEIRQRLDSLAAELQGQAAEVETLKTDLAGAAGRVTGDVNVFRSDVEGLRTEVGGLRDQVSAQATRLDEVAASAEERVAAAEQQAAEVEETATTAVDTAETNAQQALIRAAVASGAPYAEAVTALEENGVAVPPELAAGAGSGIPTIAALRDQFADAAQSAIQASVVASSGDGVLGRAGAFIKAQVASRSLTPQEGAGTDAVLSRMEDSLRNDDLAGAIAEADALPSEAGAAMSDWLEAARLRLGATEGLSALSSSTPATN